MPKVADQGFPNRSSPTAYGVFVYGSKAGMFYILDRTNGEPVQGGTRLDARIHRGALQVSVV